MKKFINIWVHPFFLLLRPSKQNHNMKKLLTILAIAGTLAACNDGADSSNNADSTNTTITTDSNTITTGPVDPDTVTLERGTDTATTTDSTQP